MFRLRNLNRLHRQPTIVTLAFLDVEDETGVDDKPSDVDNMPYTTLLYANGPGYNHNFPNGRENLTNVDTDLRAPRPRLRVLHRTPEGRLRTQEAVLPPATHRMSFATHCGRRHELGGNLDAIQVVYYRLPVSAAAHFEA
ncbi:hypothetical protein AVEN_239839-1 [Araneus ventricosus]|uniref:Uncharacterized protein n=1 Tax=Araneus ventricosus TaxID=182803 RepID=A0A4Y2R4L3_ARAVE|nr:hypothetical protein AVEN_239839-1 [Araneus ventricosus]